MTQTKRIEMLAKLCWDYMIDLNKADAEGEEIARKIDNNEPGIDIIQLKLIDRRISCIRNKFVIPIANLLHSEGVKLMKMEDGKLKLLMKDNREMIVDADESESSIERIL